MDRTKTRGFATGDVSTVKAFALAACLVLVGSFVLGYFVNLLSMLVALGGFVIYVALYSIVKYHTDLATLVGSISGAVPPVVGYVAVSNRLDLGALLLFLLLVTWQMPHFYSIAVYRSEDYAKANIPVLPLTRGVHMAKVQMVLYISAFLITASLITILGYAGYAYLGIAMVFGGSWFVLSLKGFKAKDDKRWARKMFAVSLLTIVTISASLFA
jgi:protoheme IX farnesyltransferase